MSEHQWQLAEIPPRGAEARHWWCPRCDLRIRIIGRIHPRDCPTWTFEEGSVIDSLRHEVAHRRQTDLDDCDFVIAVFVMNQ
jgi:hypothetical protein